MEEINEILSKRKVKKEFYFWMRSNSLKINSAYMSAFLDILFDVTFKNFYKSKSPIKIITGYGSDVLKAQLCHMIDIRILKEQGEFYVAGDRFKNVFKYNLKTNYEDTDVIFMNRTDDLGKKFKIKYKHNSSSSLKRINNFNSRFKFEVDDLIFDPKMVRIFSENEGNGRFYASFQRFSSEKRSRILIDSEETIERDISQCHITLIYRSHGLIEPKNLYEDIYSKDRETAKKAVCIVMYSRNLNWAKSALKYQLKLSEIEIRQIIEKLKKYPLILSSNPHRLLRLESELALKVMKELINNRMPILNVYDSYIVRKSDVAFLDEVLIKLLKPEVIITLNHVAHNQLPKLISI